MLAPLSMRGNLQDEVQILAEAYKRGGRAEMILFDSMKAI